MLGSSNPAAAEEGSGDGSSVAAGTEWGSWTSLQRTKQLFYLVCGLISKVVEYSTRDSGDFEDYT